MQKPKKRELSCTLRFNFPIYDLACLGSRITMPRVWLRYILAMEPGESARKTFERARSKAGKPKLSF